MYAYDTEAELIKAFFEFIIMFDADILTGYNTDNFDWPYLLKRAEKLNLHANFSRIYGVSAKATPKMFSSNQMGNRESFEIHIPGRISLDVFP